MAHDHNSDPAMDKALRRSLSGSLKAAGKDCPDPSVLAAYFDRELPAEETGRWEAHFSICSRCQEQLAVLARTEPSAAAAAAQPAAVGWRSVWTLRWLAPLATAAAAVVLWVAIRPAPPTVPPPVATVASEEAAAPAAAGQPTAAREADKPAEAMPAGAKDANAGLERAKKTEAVASTVPQKLPAPAAATPQSPGADKDLQVATAAAKQDVAPAAAMEKRQAENVARDATFGRRDQAQPAVVVAEAARDEAKAKPPEPAREKSGEEAAAPAVGGARSRAAAPAPEDQRAMAAGRAGVTAFRQSQILIIAAEGNVRWRLGAPGSIEKSTDRGRIWSRQPIPVTVPLIAGSAPSEKVCWAIGSGTVLRTTDGERWEKVTSPVSDNLASIAARDAMNASVTATDGKTYVTSDGGQTWQEK